MTCTSVGSRVLGAIALIAISALRSVPALAQDQAYLPFESGAQWELHSKATPQPMIFTIESLGTRARDQVARVDWQNPWVKAAFVFRASGNRVLLDGLDMGNGVTNMPDGTVYFQFDSPKGARWSNSVGSFVVANNDATVKTPSGTYSHCVQIVATDSHGSKTSWYFARGVGFVQFGEGGSAFLLTRHSVGSSASSTVAKAPSLNRLQPPFIKATEGGVYLGLESNSNAAQGFSFEAKNDSAVMSAQAGSRLIFVCPKWDEIEPSPGHYNFSDVDERVRIAKQTGAAILVNLRVIDTSRKTVPSAYRNWDWDDKRLQAKMTDVLRALSQHLEGHARWVTIGNELDGYLSSHRREIAPYARMMASITPELHRDFPNAPIAANFTSSAVNELHGMYREITDQAQINSINYYPINPNFTFRDPSSVSQELQSIISAASDKPILFQEMGYPSSTRLGSSEEKQAQFLAAVLRVIAANKSRVLAVNFNWRSDLPDSVVNDLTRYYKLNNSENFREFLSSLGWFHQDNTPKKIWYVFQQQAPAFLPAR